MKQDNPQQATTYAYVAGYFDGEATIRIQNRAMYKSQYIPQVTVTSVKIEPLVFIQELFGGWIRTYQPPSKNGQAQVAHAWSLQGRNAVCRLMHAIEPYTIVKRDHVFLMLEFIEKGEDTHPPYPVSEHEIERRRSIFEAFKEINRRGVQLQRLNEETSKDDAIVRTAGIVQPAEVAEMSTRSKELK